MPALAARGSYSLPVQTAGDCLKRFRACIAQGIDHWQDVARELIGNSALNSAPEFAGFSDVARVAELSASGFPCRQCRPGPLRDQAPLLFGEGRVEVEHERIGVAA